MMDLVRCRTVMTAVALVFTASCSVEPNLHRAAPDGKRSMMSDAEVDALVAALTLDEKIAMVHGHTVPAPLGQVAYLPGAPRLGIPELRLTDGPAGVRGTRPATALPAPVSLAASFSTDLARRYGEVLGRETRAHGADVLLGPMVNVIRVPQAGRNFETLSEDPLVTGTMAAAEVRGIQGAGAIATVKHFAGNNQEYERKTIDVRVDPQSLHEIELPGFEAAVKAGSGAVMCALNKVNGDYSCQNRALLTDILREQLAFTGWVMSDWGAMHSTAEAITAGLDMEIPGGAYFGPALKAMIESGQLAVSSLDRSVRRILAAMNGVGLLRGVPPRPAIDEQAGAELSREVAEQGAVLLRNESKSNGKPALPLDESDRESLALIGPTARTAVFGGGSSRVFPLHTTNALDELRKRAHVSYSVGIDLEGVPIPASALQLVRTDTATGKTGDDPQVDYTGASALPPSSAWRWRGTLSAPETGRYDLKLQTAGGSATLTLDGTEVLTASSALGEASSILTSAGLANTGYDLELRAGEAHAVTLTATATAAMPMQIRLAWQTPETAAAAMAKAVALADTATTVVVFGYDEVSEGYDRTSLGLNGDQDQLIERVAEANPNTIVVLNTASSVLMPWKDKVRAILETWYAGEQGGTAITRLLLGDATPGGRLTQTFPASAEQTPTADRQRYPGVDGVEQYSEGIYVGYRWYEAHGLEPLYPFGHGLSYTRFAYSGLRVRPAQDGGLDVRFTVRNTGSRSGAEVPQVYLGKPIRVPDGVHMAERSLAGFDRITLRPGQAKQLTVHVARRQLSSWSAGEARWVVPTGERTVSVGSSSRDLRLHTMAPIPSGSA